HLGAVYNKPGYEMVNNMTWVTIGDACLQEGVGLEAIQMAGHWRLNNLCVIYDNNQITCDGSVDMCNSAEDIDTKMRASGSEYPDLAKDLQKQMKGELLDDWQKYIPTKDSLPTAPTPSRKSAGLCCNPLAENIRNFMVGTADLTPSVNMAWKNKVDFQHPDLRTASGPNGDYTGRYIHWGIREHAMASVSNGMAAFQKGCILPVTSSFFMFYSYCAAGVRMGALQSLQVIHIATHDSIGTGEDGPTHQPIELAALYRAMPNFLYIRPCDSEEACGAFMAAVAAKNTPSMISVARQNTVQYPQYSSREGAQKGAYVFMEEADADVTLIGVGAEMVFAVESAKVLKEKHGVKA
ncbi:transketolase, partial [Hortaea werneckii]